MASLQTTFAELFGPAKSELPLLEQIKFDPFAFSTDKKFKRALGELGSDIIALLEKNQITSESLDPTVKELLIFISNNSSEALTSCQSPLRIGDITFKDIAGQDEAKRQLLINYIYPTRYKGLFPELPKGVLFYGPPGTGKTVLARAATAEIHHTAFYAPTPGQLKGKYEGETEKNIAAVFECADDVVGTNSYQLAIVFFDEFDSLAGQRGDDPSMTRSVNALLQAMDGIAKQPNVSVIAATNYPWSLDEAILRRFNVRIFIDLPDPEAIEYIIRTTMARAYGNPTLSRSDRIKDVRNPDGTFNDEAGFLKNILRYGADKKPTGGLLGLGGSTDNSLTIKYIKDLVGKFGPTKEGEAIIAEIRGGGTVEEDDSRLIPKHIFGYSPSDISKVMDIAIKNAAVNALDGTATQVRFKVGTGSTRIGTEGTYWVVDSKAKGPTEKNIRIDQIPEGERNNIVTFSIYVPDFEEALGQYSSTIDSKSYAKLLTYSRTQ